MIKWLVDRFGAGPIWRNVLKRRVAGSPWYFGDGATLTALLLVLIVTGALMSLTYTPDVDSAHASVRYLTHEQPLGWLIRGLHYWSAGLMVVMLFFHVFRQILVAGYKSPREGTWLIGVLLFFAVLFMSFSGYLLRWDERSIAAIKVATHMAYNVPWIGEWLVILMQGGREIGSLTLTRIFGLHVIIVPLIILALVGYHLYLVILKGTTSPSERQKGAESADDQREIYHEDAESDERGERFYPKTMADSGLVSYSFIALATILTFTLGPAEILPEASLYTRSEPMEEWWFWWYSGLIALLPESIAPGFVVVFPLVVFVAMALLPFLDRGPMRGMRDRPIAIAFVCVSVIVLLVLSALRRESPWTARPTSEPPPAPPGVELSAEAEEGRRKFPEYGCNTCHSVGGHGSQSAVDLAQIDPMMSREELAQFISNPPGDVAMPSYADIPPEDLDSLVAFVLAAQTFPREYER